MKTKFYALHLSLIMILACIKINAQNANTALSNLKSPTKVNVNLLPDENNKHDIGSGTKGWRNIYFDGSLYSGKSKLITNKIGTDSASIAIGTAVLATNTTGFGNTGVGYNSLFTNTSGNANNAVGTFALYANVNGGANVADGYEALYSNNVGSDNTAIGAAALSFTTTGNDNTGLGYTAGASLTTGKDNVFIGSFSDCVSTGHITNGTAIGFNSFVTANNHVVIGNSSVISIGGYANWSNISDGRVKKNIKQNVPGLSFINKLQPITYNLDLDVADKIIDRPEVKSKEGKIVQPTTEELQSRKAKEQIVYTGFVAQDVEKAAQSLHYDFSGVDKPDNANTLYGLRYSDFVVPLVKAVQQLSKMNDAKDSAINNLQNQINELKAMIAGKQSAVNGEQLATISSSSLSQNIPNPFSNSTTISYSIPLQHFTSAKIIITDKNGNALKTITLSNNK
ncbi:MAG TPA: tail fiber domain-containing protein, partial [Parafilimonas sp.]